MKMHFHVELHVKCLSCMCVINMIVHKIALSHIYEFYQFFSVVAILVVMCKGKAGMVIWLERGADLHMAQLMPLPLTVSCCSKIQTGFIFLVLAHLGSPGKGPLNGCVCVRA